MVKTVPQSAPPPDAFAGSTAGAGSWNGSRLWPSSGDDVDWRSRFCDSSSSGSSREPGRLSPGMAQSPHLGERRHCSNSGRRFGR